MAPSQRMKKVLAVLDKLGLQYMVGGSFASSTWGHSRQTNDLDLILQLPSERVADLVEAFTEEYSLSLQEVERAVQSKEAYRDFQLLDNEGYFKVDVFLLNDTPYEQSEFSRRTLRELMPGVFAPCSSAEDIVLRKLQWYDLGGRRSDRQWNDIQGVLVIRFDLLDFGYMRTWGTRVGIQDLLETAILEATKKNQELKDL